MKSLGDIALHTITIHPDDDDLWFVTSYINGLLVTRDGGDTWENYFAGAYIPVLEIDPNDPSRVFIGIREDLYLSLDYGQTWRAVKSFPRNVISILVSEVDNSIYIGLRWEDTENQKLYIATEIWDLYILTEGAGLYYSSNFGDEWKYLGN